MILTGRGRIAGVMGWPVAHSRSPCLHGYWLRYYGIDGAYVPFPVAPDRLAAALRALPLLGIAGVNLTVPHKEAALAVLDDIAPMARRIGAVNTVVVGPDGRLIGDNTDALGFMAHLRASAPDWSPAAGPAAVLGAGGAARAVVVALRDAGVAGVRIVNRTLARSEALAADLGADVRPWSERDAALAGVRLVVNTTTQGMAGQPPLDLALDRLDPGAIVYDLVYVPLETPLLATARARGCRVIDGLGMLLHQARPGFRAWFMVDPEVTPELRAFVMASLQA